MKHLNQYIIEKFKIKKDIQLNEPKEECPKDKKELELILTNRFMNYYDEKTNTLDVSNIDVTHLNNLHACFNVLGRDLIYIKRLKGIEDWDVSNSLNLANMFNCFENLEELDLSSWNVSNCQHMYNMFANCKNLKTTGDLSSWNTHKVLKINRMFADCQNLENIGNIDNWNLDKCIYKYDVFENCKKLDYRPKWYKEK